MRVWVIYNSFAQGMHIASVTYMLFFLISLLFSEPAHVQESPYGTVVGDTRNLEPVTGSWNPNRFEEGYVLGTLAEVEARGIFVTTLEGKVKVGVTSTKGGFFDSACFESEMSRLQESTPQVSETDRQSAIEKCTDPINPWPFSSYNEDLLASFQQISGKLVLVFYRSYMILPFTESNNYFQKIYFVDPDILQVGAQLDVSSSMAIARNLNYGEGFLEGRIVKAAIEGVIRKTWEFVIQVGNTGDLFRSVSVNDEDLFNFGLKAMSTARYLKISYYDLLNPVASPINLIGGYNTDLRAFRIEIIPDPRQEMPSHP